MDKNTWVGFLLIAAIIVGFTMLNRPSKEQLAERQRVQDSINLARMAQIEAQRLSDSIQMTLDAAEESIAVESEETKPEEEWVTLENEHLRLTLSSYGGVIQRAELLDYHASGDSIKTSNLYFTPVAGEEPNKAILRLPTADENAWLDFVYELSDSYMVHLSLVPHNMQNVLAQNMNSLELQWRQLIPQQEQGRKFEERYAQLQYMLSGGEMEKLSESKDDDAKESARVRWIGYKDQFFSTVLIADDAFSSSQFSSKKESITTRKES